LWTERLTKTATTVTAVDAAPETLALNRTRVGCANVRYIEADLFQWQPDRQYDVVFFSFWLSHVPPERFDAFWSLVRYCLKPQGRVFFLDSRYQETSTATDHLLEGKDAVTVLRRLKDGQEYRIVKVFYEPDDLIARLRCLGWDMTVQTTPHYFVYGDGRPTR
jgi:ubiquinone/menaquinone biosynthesis C-methylase UbiE